MNKPKAIKLTNTRTGKKESLETIVPGRLTMYSCGPTVYNLIHIGNLRTGLVADMIYRFFKRSGYEVTYVRNFTDVDDKIIKKANEEGITAEALAKKYTVEVEKDYGDAGMLQPTHKPSVTTHIPDIIGLIQRIIANGKAYVVDGEVIFSIDSFKNYGKLSGKNIEELQAGIRVDVSEKKKNPLDFTLWKPAKPGEPFWESPWGKGRPGWHIECSAMSSRWLGDQIDVHHGGEDLVFPHHENEVAQSEAASGKTPFVKYWLHNAMLNMSKEKMSKSLGNIVMARDFLQEFGREVARYLLLSVHYRSMLDFGEESIEQTLTGLQRIYEAKAKALELIGDRQRAECATEEISDEPWRSFVAEARAAGAQIDENFANDLNTPGALGVLFSLIRNFNRILAAGADTKAKGAAVGACLLVELMEQNIGEVLGIGYDEPRAMLAKLEEIRAARLAKGGVARMSEDEIKGAIQARADARKAKNFAEADRIRKDLEARGVLLKDGAGGTSWQYK